MNPSHFRLEESILGPIKHPLYSLHSHTILALLHLCLGILLQLLILCFAMGEGVKVRAIVVMLAVVICATMPPTISSTYCPPPKGKPGGPKHPSPPKGKPPKPPVVHPPVKPPPSGGHPPYPPSPPCPPTTPTPTPVTPSPPASKTCPKDALKIGACVDLLGGLVNIGMGDPVVNQCCPVLEGLLAAEAALCLCTAIRAKVLNLNIYLPLALQLLASCGKNAPAGFTCPTT